MAESIITLGIGSSPGSIEPFLLVGLTVGAAVVQATPPTAQYLVVDIASADVLNQMTPVSSKNSVEVAT